MCIRDRAESVIKQLETIGVLGKKNEDGTHTVMMDKDAFINHVRGYQDLAERMRAVAASKNANLSDAVSYTHLDVYKRQLLTRMVMQRARSFLSVLTMRMVHLRKISIIQ